MTLCIVVRSPEGLVLAAESRTTTLVDLPPLGTQLAFIDDEAVKLFAFKPPNTAIGAVIYGSGGIDQKPLYTFLPDFEATLPGQRLSVQGFAQNLSDFFVHQRQMGMAGGVALPEISFVVAGFDPGKPDSKVVSFAIPKSPVVVERNADLTGSNVELFLGGQRRYIDRLVLGFDQGVLEIVAQHFNLEAQQRQSLLQALNPLKISPVSRSLQDCVDLAIFLIHITVEAEKIFTPWRTSCGGEISVATITKRDHLKFMQLKK